MAALKKSEANRNDSEGVWQSLKWRRCAAAESQP